MKEMSFSYLNTSTKLQVLTIRDLNTRKYQKKKIKNKIIFFKKYIERLKKSILL